MAIGHLLKPAGRYFTSAIKNIGKPGSINVTNIALGAGFSLFDIYRYRKEAPDRPMSEAALKAAGIFTLWTFFPQAGFIYTFGKGALDLGTAIGRVAGATMPSPGYREGLGGNFFDNQAKATMRRRAVAALQASRINAHSVLGSEARRIGRGYFEY